ncbi:N-acetylmuramoyl-L-alanine amidase [Pontibacter silvestris]|uniref:N-acetylmuramoyl-L-alanine amidase n=1 Tax=Pontibacter silvestris TaxID=2305183 RepID=A0ABW4WW25_9BACT|nr:N-acetylmuramoyl-L-alanine amidase [Pontibacter silvestris]MCC9137412.1 N-acetylmuramoyl-L-alanine amidase [Pontibacter silvestris]
MRTYLFLLILIITSLQAYAQSTYQEVVAKSGDGVYVLLRRYGLNPSEHLHAFLELNKGKLGKDHSLYIGKIYRLPIPASAVTTAVKAEPSATASKASPKLLHIPLFGNKYERVDIKDQQLRGAVYYLSSGHGGPDPGAVGKYGSYQLAEDEYAYDVTIRLARTLMEHGATVYMIVQDPKDGIRDENILKMNTDEVNYPNQPIAYNHTQRLRQRTDAINKLYAQHKGAYQRMLAIHVDSRSKSQNIDVFFYHHENSPLGQKLAETIHQTFTNNYNRHQPNRDYSGNVSQRSSLYVVKHSHPPTVFIELGNIRNDLDQRRFVIPNNRQALANWICEGIITDYASQQGM